MPKKPKKPHRLSLLRSLTSYPQQAAFAKLVGIPLATLQSIELGRRSLTPDLAHRITLATGVDEQWLLGKRDRCCMHYGPDPYDTGDTMHEDDLLDVLGLVRRLTDRQDKVGQYFEGLLPAEAKVAVSEFFKASRRPISFSAANILAYREIVSRLRNPSESDRIGRYLSDKLSPSTKAQLDIEPKLGDVSEVRHALALDLDRVLRSGPLFDSNRFQVGALPKHLVHEIAGHPAGEELVRLNLKLLSFAFDGAFSLGPALNMDSLALDVASGLARIIEGDVVHDPEVFVRVALRPKTKRLLSSKPKGEFRARLNRLLLEDAFPDLISREHGRGWGLWQTLLLRRDAPPDPSAPSTDQLADLPLGWAEIVSSRYLYPIKVLLLASAKPGAENSLAVQQQLYFALHKIANDFGFDKQIHAILKELRSKPGAITGVDSSILDKDDSWEWLFYGPPPSGAGKIARGWAKMAKQHEGRLRKRFKRYRPS